MLVLLLLGNLPEWDRTPLNLGWIITSPDHDDVTKWKHFPRYWPFVRGIDLRLNKRLGKQSWGWWFETLARPLWRHRNDNVRCNLFMSLFMPMGKCWRNKFFMEKGPFFQLHNVSAYHKKHALLCYKDKRFDNYAWYYWCRIEICAQKTWLRNIYVLYNTSKIPGKDGVERWGGGE